MSECGCHDEDEITSVMCVTHFTALKLRSFQHDEAHRDCCDASLLRGEVKDVGAAVVCEAIGTMPDKPREYWQSLFNEMAAETGLQDVDRGVSESVRPDGHTFGPCRLPGSTPETGEAK